MIVVADSSRAVKLIMLASSEGVMPDIMTSEQRSERMSRVRNKDSKPEMRVRSLLHRLGFRFRVVSYECVDGPSDLALSASSD